MMGDINGCALTLVSIALITSLLCSVLLLFVDMRNEKKLTDLTPLCKVHGIENITECENWIVSHKDLCLKKGIDNYTACANFILENKRLNTTPPAQPEGNKKLQNEIKATQQEITEKLKKNFNATQQELIEKLEKNIDAIQQEIGNNVRRKFLEFEEEMKKHKNNYNSLRSDILQLKEEFAVLLNELYVIRGKQDYEISSRLDADFVTLMMFIFGMVAVVNFVLLITLWKNMSKVNGISQQQRTVFFEKGFSWISTNLLIAWHWVTDKVKKSQLWKTYYAKGNLSGIPLYVMSFDGTTQKQHEKLVKSIVDDQTPIRPVLISCQQDLSKLPPSKGMIICVDHVTNDKIMDNRPSINLTIETLETIPQMNETIIVVYCGDPESQYLKDSNLFNSNLLDHPVYGNKLSVGNLRISVNDEFSSCQKNAVLSKISSVKSSSN